MTPTTLRPHSPRPFANGPAWPSFAPVGVPTATAATVVMVVLMMMVVGLMPTAVAAENVAPNPGFEYGANGRPTFSGGRFDGRSVA